MIANNTMTESIWLYKCFTAAQQLGHQVQEQPQLLQMSWPITGQQLHPGKSSRPLNIAALVCFHASPAHVVHDLCISFHLRLNLEASIQTKQEHTCYTVG